MEKTRDLLVINAVTGLAAVNFLLKTKGTPLETPTWFYVLTWLISLIMLLFIQVYHGHPSPTDVTDYDENLRRKHLPWLLGGVIAMLMISSIMVAGYTESSLYVPRPGAVLSTTPLSTESLMDDVLYNFVLVAPAEETLKLMVILAIFLKIKNLLISVGFPVGVWATFHAYFAYSGPLMPVLVFSAFLSGIVLFLVLKKTGSLLNAITAHGSFNTTVIFASFISVFLIILVFVAIALIVVLKS